MNSNVKPFKSPIKLDSIITPGKQGELYNINSNEILKQLDINFTISHIFFLNNLNTNESRGNHSNYSISELLICMSGSFDIKLDDGKNETTYTIHKNEVIYVPENVWLSFFNFKNCVILVLVDKSKEDKTKKKSEYDYETFKKMKKIM